MQRVEPDVEHGPRGVSAVGSVPVDLGAGLALTLAVLAGTWRLLGLPASHILIGGALYAALAGLLAWTRPSWLPGPGLGPANRVTLARAVLAMPIFALSIRPGALGVGTRWWIIALATVVLALDGVDGRVARRTGTRSAFGARFDMELDAALIMALSLLVWQSGRAGLWVLLIGLMRYAFIAASWIWPKLGAELPPSQRRRVVCVVQGVVLLVALGPIIPAALAVAVVVGGLVTLTWSFAVDVAWALANGVPPER